MNYENNKNYYIEEITDSPVIEITNNNNENNEKEIILDNKNNIICTEIEKLFEKRDEFNDKINFIKEQLSNNKLKKSVSNNLLNIIENIEKSIDVIDETIISNGIIEN